MASKPPIRHELFELMKKISPENPKIKEYQDWRREKPIVKLKEKEPITLYPIDPKSFYRLFIDYYHKVNGKEFDENANHGEGKLLVWTILLYLLKDQKFFNSPLLHGASSPSFSKGLLVLGEKGCGKTTTFMTFNKLMKNASVESIMVKNIKGDSVPFVWYLKFSYFAFYDSSSIVQEYEGYDKKGDRKYFWRKMKYSTAYFDDVLKERMSNNYGKVDLFREIFEIRYLERSLTHISCNYDDDIRYDVDSALKQFYLKYGSRVYDRLFSMFNIIALKGGSLRR